MRRQFSAQENVGVLRNNIQKLESTNNLQQRALWEGDGSPDSQIFLPSD
jgi:hypothetical protein